MFRVCDIGQTYSDLLLQASYKFLELLQGRGGDIEMKDNDGQTPLHLTTRNHHAVCLAFVLKHLSPGMVDVTDNQNVQDCLS